MVEAVDEPFCACVAVLEEVLRDDITFQVRVEERAESGKRRVKHSGAGRTVWRVVLTVCR